MTNATMGTATEGVLYGIKNEDLINEDQLNPYDLKFGLVKTPSTAQGEITFDVDLFKEHGIKRLLGVKSWVNTTVESVIATATVTTTVNNGILTITVDTANTNNMRVYLLIGV